MTYDDRHRPHGRVHVRRLHALLLTAVCVEIKLVHMGADSSIYMARGAPCMCQPASQVCLHLIILWV